MGAFSELYMPKTVAAGPTMEQANASLATAMARLDKVLDSKNPSTKAIAAASTAVNKATAALATATTNRIDNPVTNTNTNTNPDPGLSTSSLENSGPSAEPITPAAIPLSTPTIVAPVIAPPVKTAPIDTLLFDQESVSTDALVNLIFENIGGQELINITRNDIVNGQEVVYQPIKNLSSIQQQYNPNNILSLQSTSDKYFANFSIKLENRIPNPGTGPNGSYVYLDNNTGNLIIEAVNLELDEQIEAEITVSGTIYEAEFGESASW